VAASPVPAAKSSGKAIPILLGTFGLVALAVVGALVLTRAKPEAPVAQASAPEAPPSAAAPAAPATPAAAPGAPAPPVAASPAAAAAASDSPDPEPAGKAGGAQGGGHANVRRGSVGRKAGAAPPPGSGGSTVSALSSMMAESTGGTTTPPPSGGALGDAVQHAVGANGAPAAAAAPDIPAAPTYAAGSVPEKPSQGTISSALGSVLPQARSCLNPEDPVSRAHITFGSSGSVSAVSVTGHAAGTPVEGCIKSALLKAKVPPFADPSYGATVTVRPN
jgi:hypothetical protein